MSETKIINIGSAKGALKAKLEASINIQMLKDIGQQTVNHIQGEIRAGNDPKTGSRQPKPSVKPGPRIKIASLNNTHPAYSPRRPNATITGKFVDSLTFQITGRKITIHFAGTHPGYKTIKGRTKRVFNSDIARGLTSRRIGYSLLGISDIWLANIERIIRDAIRRSI